MQEVVHVPALIQMKRPCQSVDAVWKEKGKEGYIYILHTVHTCY